MSLKIFRIRVISSVMLIVFIVVLSLTSMDAATGERSGLGEGLLVNLIRNGDFEHHDGSQVPLDWQDWIEGEDDYSVTVDDLDGSRVLRLEGTGGSGGRAHVFQRDIPAEEYRGKTLVLRGRYKGNDVDARSHYIGVEFLDEYQNEKIAPTAAIFPPAATTDWIVLEREILIPDEAVFIGIHAVLLNGSGTIWWDDIELREGTTVSQPLGETFNLLQNSVFWGAEYGVPPPAWTLYGSLINGHKITVVDSDHEEQRALMLEDMVDIPRGNEGEIGLHQTVLVQSGHVYRATVSAAAVEGFSPNRSHLQLRFFPSNEFKQIPVSPNSTQFQSFSAQLVAPEGTTHARVYFYTAAATTPKILIRSIELWRIDP